MRFAHFQFDARKDKLGEGPSSEVFKAVDTRLGRTVALKILRPHVEFDIAATERFEREAKHTSNLSHKNIATIFEYGSDRGTSYIAMEYLEGRTLDVLLRDHPFDYEQGVRIALEVSNALGLVHQRGLIHRDLKPANIMVMDDGTVKLLDFGICRSTNESTITQEGMLVGTVLYMSPEQVLGEELDVRSDIFAFGSVFYHALTGELPFPGKSFPEVCLSILEAQPRAPAEIRSGFPAPLSAFLLRCLSRDKAERFASAGAAHAELQTLTNEYKSNSSSDRPSGLEGCILIFPFELEGDGGTSASHDAAQALANAPRTDDAARSFARGLRADLSSELTRSTNLEVRLPESMEVPSDLRNTFLLRGTLRLEEDTGSLEYLLERARNTETADTSRIWRERLEHSDNDEWGLQGKLVGSLVRSVKRRLVEFTLAPPPEEKRDPQRAEDLANQAHMILHRGTTRHLMSAMATFRTALKEDPSCVLAHAGLAEAYVHKFMNWDGDISFLQEAREQAQLALGMDSYSAEAHTSLGYASLMSGSLDEAQREFRLAIQIDHEEWLAHRLLGALYARLGNFEGASPLLQRAIVLRPTHIGSYDHLYGVLCRLDRYLEALEVADRGIEVAKKHLEEVESDQEARLHLGRLLARMGRAEDAREIAEDARRRAPKDPYTLFHSACIYALIKDEELALQRLRESQERGYYLQSEALQNSDLEPLRGKAEFQVLLG